MHRGPRLAALLDLDGETVEVAPAGPVWSPNALPIGRRA
jgi:hypothetical protein